MRSALFAPALRASTAAALALVTAATATAQLPDVVPSAIYLQPQRLVPVDGARRLNLYCVGTGLPIILLDAGAGENMMVWRHVQHRLAAETRVCAYDRAGYGFSDAATRPSDARNAVDDIHRLLRAARLPTPVIYVGHSAAGLYGRLLVARYPRDVAGAVLVDPAFAHAEAQMMATFSSEERGKLTDFYAGVLTFLRGCLTLAQSGALRSPSAPEAAACVDTRGYRDDIDEALRQELARQYAEPKLMAAALSEYGSVWPGADLLSVNSQQIDAMPSGFGTRPLEVLIHDGTNDPPSPGLTAAQQVTLEQARVAALTALAQTSTRGSATVVPRSAHHIQFDQPEAVMAAVRRVLREVRSTR